MLQMMGEAMKLIKQKLSLLVTTEHIVGRQYSHEHMHVDLTLGV